MFSHVPWTWHGLQPQKVRTSAWGAWEPRPPWLDLSVGGRGFGLRGLGGWGYGALGLGLREAFRFRNS